MGWLVHSFGWRSVFWAMGGFGILAAPIFWRSIRSSATHPQINRAEVDLIEQGGGLIRLEDAAKTGPSARTLRNVGRLLSSRMLLGIYVGQYSINVLTYFFVIARKPGAEYLVTVRARARGGAVPLVPTGSVIGWEQFALGAALPVRTQAARGRVAIIDRGGIVALSAGPASLTIDRTTGLLKAYTVGGADILHGGAPNSTACRPTTTSAPASMPRPLSGRRCPMRGRSR